MAKIYIFVALALAAFDGVWLGFVTRGWYGRLLAPIFEMRFSPLPAVIFYLIYAAAVSYFVVMPRMNASVSALFFTGAFFGIAAYAAYDLTNQATVKDWPIIVTMADMAWGAFATGTSAVIARALARMV